MEHQTTILCTTATRARCNIISPRAKRNIGGFFFGLLLVIMPTLGLVSCSISNPDGTTDQQRLAEQQAAAEAQQALAYRNAITALLKGDDAMAKQFRGDDSRIAMGMRRLDLSQCPRDFAIVYVDHIHAWDDAATIKRALSALYSKENVQNILGETLVQKLFNANRTALDDAADTESTLKAAAIEASARIKQTYNDVERLAVSYGAQLPG